MKRIIFSLIVFTLMSLNYVSVSGTPIDLSKTVPPPIPTVQNSTMESTNPEISDSDIPVSATIGDTDLSICFDYAVGDAVITVYDTDNNIVYQGTINTDSSLNVFIPSNLWTAGDYIITISYDNEYLTGNFQK